MQDVAIGVRTNRRAGEDRILDRPHLDQIAAASEVIKPTEPNALYVEHITSPNVARDRRIIQILEHHHRRARQLANCSTCFSMLP